MQRIAIVTDSTADIPTELAADWGITVIPLTVNFGCEQFKDGIDISSDEFYPKLAASPQLPTTSQPSPAEFKEVYENLLQDHASIISIHLSSGLSGTIAAAEAAKEMVAGDIHLFDSKSISLGIAVIVAEAVDLVRQGLSVTEVMQRLEQVRENTEVLFTIDTFEYLHKGGRIGGVKAVMGALLNIKPIVRVIDGVYVPIGKARRQEQALRQMVRLFQDLAAGRTVKRIAVAHGAAAPLAKKLAAQLETAFDLRPTILTQVGPVIGVHTGPGTLGACIQVES